MNELAEPKKTGNKFWYVYGFILIIIFGVSLALRTLPMHTAVFDSSWVNIQAVDGYYHLRLVENLLQHFPFRISFDPYTYFPYGQDVYFAPLFDLLAGFCAWVVGLGSPDLKTIETVAAYFPAVLGALVTIPVYFIGKILWNRPAGLISALLIGIFPGTFLFRSRLGFFDHHVAEVLFSTVVVLFLFLALKSIREHPISYDDIRKKNWKLLTKPLLFAGLSGIALGSYLLAWVGGMLFVFLLFCWVVIMFIIEHLKKKSTDYICILGIPIFLLALLIVIPFLNQIAYSNLYVISLSIGLVAPLGLSVISRMLEFKNVQRIYYPLMILGAGVIGFLFLYIFFPSVANAIMVKFRVFSPDENGLTISEVKPLLFSQGNFTLDLIWREFTTGTIVAPIAFILMIVSLVKNISSEKVLLLLWTGLIFLASMAQVRFAAYLAVIFALLSGYFYSEILSWITRFFKWLYSVPFKGSATITPSNRRKSREKAKLSSAKRADSQVATVPASSTGSVRYKLPAISLALILVFLIGVYPNIGSALSNAQVNSGISSDWRDSLLWMKNNTPEPFSNADFYYQNYKKSSDGQYVYPKSAYGVLAWWDYGHMITEIAHRIPNANPTQAGAATAASFFISQNEVDANKQLDTLGTRYIIIDYDIAAPYGIANNMISGKKFYAMPTWAGTDQLRYCEIFYQPKDGKLYAVPMYYPDYYYCLSSRLFNFHGAAVLPENSTTVISFTQQSGRNIIQTNQTFTSYEEGKKFLDKQTSPNYRIVGTSPFISPVPLEKLSHYNELAKSQSGISYNNQKTNSSYIEIFQYVP